MTCETCDGRGIVIVNWTDAEPGYAVCLCAVGRIYRNRTNADHQTVFPLWLVWAAREQIDPARVLLLEDVCPPDELAVRGFAIPAHGAVDDTALIALGKTKRPRL